MTWKLLCPYHSILWYNLTIYIFSSDSNAMLYCVSGCFTRYQDPDSSCFAKRVLGRQQSTILLLTICYPWILQPADVEMNANFEFSGNLNSAVMVAGMVSGMVFGMVAGMVSGMVFGMVAGMVYFFVVAVLFIVQCL